MKSFYVFTGYDVGSGGMTTQRIYDVQKAYDVISYYQKMPARYKSVRDFEFDVKANSSHGHALIINNDPKYRWSTYFVG